MNAPEKIVTDRCFHSHKPLDLGGGKVIYGGNCSKPVVTDADIYVSLDRSFYDIRSYPWSKGPVAFLFGIQDQGIPESHKDFMDMICWLNAEIEAGKKVHVGCIGGHGRTGMVLAALVSLRCDALKTAGLEPFTDDPIAYVRKHYCEKAVESQKQIDFLVNEWKCKTAKARYAQWTGGNEPKKYLWEGEWHPKTYPAHDGYKQKGKAWSGKAKDSGEPQRRHDMTLWTSKVSWKK